MIATCGNRGAWQAALGLLAEMAESTSPLHTIKCDAAISDCQKGGDVRWRSDFGPGWSRTRRITTPSAAAPRAALWNGSEWQVVLCTSAEMPESTTQRYAITRRRWRTAGFGRDGCEHHAARHHHRQRRDQRLREGWCVAGGIGRPLAEMAESTMQRDAITCKTRSGLAREAGGS